MDVNELLPLIAVVAVIVIFWRIRKGSSIAPAKAREMVESGQAQLLDVRTDQEWGAAHLAHARHIPLHDLAKRADELDKSKPVICYCASGMRSGAAVRMLKGKGFDAHNLGPMTAWPA